MTKRRVEREKRVIKLMIELYCHQKHQHKSKGLCEECQGLLDYAHQRLSFCKFGDEKTTCQKCPIHCYKKEMKQQVKEVMRFSGPRVLIYSPIEFFRHMFD